MVSSDWSGPRHVRRTTAALSRAAAARRPARAPRRYRDPIRL